MPDEKKRAFVTVYMPVDTECNTKSVAAVFAPRTYGAQIMKCNRNPSVTLMGRQLHISVGGSAEKIMRNWKWIKNDLGITKTWSREIENMSAVRVDQDVKPWQTLVDSGAYYVMFTLTHKYGLQRIPVDIIDRSYISGVEKIVVKSLKMRHALKARELAARYPRIVYYTAGVAPKEIDSWKGETTLSSLRDLLRDHQCVAVGEIGISEDNSEKQVEMFTAQVNIACQFDKPLIISNMTEKIVEILDRFESRLPPVCVLDEKLDVNTATLYHSKGYYIAITGQHYRDREVPWMSTWLNALMKTTDATRILLASNSPYCFPNKIRTTTTQTIAYQSACVKMPLVHRITRECTAAASKYQLHRQNEPLGLQNLVQLIGLAVEPEVLAKKTRDCAYAFYNFQEVDSKLGKVLDDESDDLPKTKNGCTEGVYGSERGSNSSFTRTFLLIAAVPLILLLIYSLVCGYYFSSD